MKVMQCGRVMWSVVKWVKWRCAVPVYQHCATTYTLPLINGQSIHEDNQIKSFILHSIQEVSKEICRIMVGMWAGGVERGFDTIWTSPSFSCAKLDPRTATTIHQWKDRREALMAWLDLSVWVRCRPECGYEEIFYLPTWPFLDGPGRAPFLGMTLPVWRCSWAVRVTKRNFPFKMYLPRWNFWSMTEMLEMTSHLGVLEKWAEIPNANGSFLLRYFRRRWCRMLPNLLHHAPVSLRISPGMRDMRRPLESLHPRSEEHTSELQSPA